MMYRIVHSAARDEWLVQEKFKYWPWWSCVDYGYYRFSSLERALECVEKIKKWRTNDWKQVWP